MKTKFFTFDQNNSGGYFVEDEKNGVCEYVIIEAHNAENAINRLESIGDLVPGFWNYCGCCGERWSTWMDDSDGTSEPEIWGKPLSGVEQGPYTEKAAVHKIDGSFEMISFKRR